MKRPTLSLVLALLMATPALAQDADRAIETMRDVAQRCPRAYANAHRNENQHPEAWDFIILATQALQRIDPLFGLNGKRGNPNDPSSDAIAYGSGRDVRIYDIIVGAGEHGDDLSRIVFHDVTAESTVDGVVMGVYIDPRSRQPRVPCGSAPDPPAGDVWDQRHSDLVRAVAATFGTGDARAFLRRAAEQLAYSFSNETWGNKSADPSRPPSVDVIARRAGARLVGYRLLGGGQVSLPPPVLDITGQHFIAVTPTNHVGDTPGTGGGGSGGGSGSLQPVLDKLAALEALVREAHVKLDALGENAARANEQLARQADALSLIDSALSGVAATADDTRRRLETVVELVAHPTSTCSADHPAGCPQYVGRLGPSTIVLRPR